MPIARPPNCTASREARTLENALARLVHAETVARCLDLRMMQRARTWQEGQDIRDVTDVRIAIEDARRILAGFHPNRLEAGQ